MKKIILLLSTLLFSFASSATTIGLSSSSFSADSSVYISSSSFSADVSVYITSSSFAADAEICVSDDFSNKEAVAAFIALGL